MTIGLNIGCDDNVIENSSGCNFYIGIDNLCHYDKNLSIHEKIDLWKDHVSQDSQYTNQTKKFKGKFVVADANNLPFKDNVFIKVNSSRFIGRYKIKNVIEETYRVLKNNGKFEIYSSYVLNNFFNKLIFDLLKFFEKINLKVQNFDEEENYMDIMIKMRKPK